MKYILLLLLSFNLYAQSESQPAEPLVFCGLESHEQIDACSLDDKFGIIMGTLHPDLNYRTYDSYHMEDPCDPLTIDNEETEEVETCPVWDQKTGFYTYQEQVLDENQLPTLSMYERLDMLSKPLLSAFETGLADWKTSTKAKLDFRVSVETLDRFRRRMVKCGYNQPNMALLKKSLIEQMDTIKRDCLSSHTATLDAEDEAQARRDQIIKDMSFAKDIEIDFVSLIRSGVKDTARNKRLLSKLGTVQALLKVGDIDGAREELDGISADADLSQGAKDMVLAKMDAYLGQ